MLARLRSLPLTQQDMGRAGLGVARYMGDLAGPGGLPDLRQAPTAHPYQLQGSPGWETSGLLAPTSGLHQEAPTAVRSCSGRLSSPPYTGLGHLPALSSHLRVVIALCLLEVSQTKGCVCVCGGGR